MTKIQETRYKHITNPNSLITKDSLELEYLEIGNCLEYLYLAPCKA